NADACSGVAGCSAFITTPIPFDPYGPATQVSGVFTCFGCTSITPLTSASYTAPSGGDGEQTIQFTFTTSISMPVFAWGGHIANEIDWGQGQAAGNINGSSYHMRIKDLDGKGGNQDRSLSAGAVP